MGALFRQKLIYASVRAFQFAVVGFFIYLVYFFYMPEQSFAGFIVENPIYFYVKDLDLWMYFVQYFIVLSLVNTGLFYFLSLYFDWKKEKIKNKRTDLEYRFTEKIIEYIYSDLLNSQQTTDDFLGWFKQEARTKLSHEMLFRVMTKTQETIAEDLSGKFRAIIDHLGIEQRLEFFLHSRNLSHKVIALKVISYLRMPGYKKTIETYSHRRNHVLRTEAMAALIRLSDSNHLGLLMFQNHLITKLDINIILNAVKKNFKDDINYERLIGCASPRIEAIGVLLIKHKNRLELKERIRPILNQKDEFLHEVTWEVFATVASTEEDYQFMLEHFEHENEKNKLAVINGLKRFAKHEHLDEFLSEVIEKQPLYIKIEALKLLFVNNFGKLVGYHNIEEPQVAAAYNEIIDINIH